MAHMLSWCKSELRAELNNQAERVMYREIQRECFPEDISALASGQALPRSSKLCKLSPFMDGEGIVRVGGRLHESGMCYDTKHRVILSK